MGEIMVCVYIYNYKQLQLFAQAPDGIEYLKIEIMCINYQNSNNILPCA